MPEIQIEIDLNKKNRRRKLVQFCKTPLESDDFRYLAYGP